MNRIIFLFIGLFAFQYVSLANFSDFPQDSSSQEMVYDMPEIMPQFPGGGNALDQFIRDNIKYPQQAIEQGIQGKVYVQFIVEKDGSVTNIVVRRGVHQLLDNEAVRVVKLMPNWTPGTMRGKKVRVRYTLPITFSLT